MFKTPHNSIIIYAVLGFIFASAGEFRQLAMLSSASYMIIYLGVVLSVMRFRFLKRGEPGVTGIFMGYVIPAISGAVIIWVLSKLPGNEIIGMLIFLLIISVVYFAIKFMKIESKSER